MNQPGSSGSLENVAFSESNGAFPSRRELRAQRVSPSKPTAHPAVQPPIQAPRPVRSAPRSKRKSPLTTAVTLIAIPGLFLTAALPAYAFSPPNGQGETVASATHTLATSEAQGVTVAATAVSLRVARDGFTATTPEELASREGEAKAAASADRAAKAARASAAEYAVYGIQAEGDDYPWPYEVTNSQGGNLFTLGYYYRECVDFVAWRLNRGAGTTDPWRWTWRNLTSRR